MARCCRVPGFVPEDVVTAVNMPVMRDKTRGTRRAARRSRPETPSSNLDMTGQVHSPRLIGKWQFEDPW